MKVTILMPTYNDEDSIIETLVSLNNQSYRDWELLIMDDGSTDNTEVIANRYICDNQLNAKYYKQKNADQLNAIENLIPYIKGDVVFILHSDDLLASVETLTIYTDYIKQNPGFDSYYGDLVIIDENSKATGSVIKPKILKRSEKTLVQTYLWLGRNSYVDYSFFTKDFFINQVRKRYLISNKPYWFDKEFSKISKSLYVPHPMAKYRIHSDNYINNSVGNSTVLSGNLRVFTSLMSIYNIPFFNQQYLIYRLVNKINPRFSFKPFYFRKEQHNKNNRVRFVIEKRLGTSWKKNQYYISIIGFFAKTKKPRTVNFDNNIPDFVYKGRDASKFFKNLEENRLEEKYYIIMEQIRQGFTHVTVSEKNIENARTILDFFCISDFVMIDKLER